MSFVSVFRRLTTVAAAAAITRNFHTSSLLFAGHSKWNNIKHDKAINDRKRTALFSKISKAIMTATRMGGSDVANNPTLSLQISRAKACNMPKERIQKAIESGSGVQQGEMAQEITFEGTGPKGSAVIVQCLTLSRNRIVQSLRHAMDKNGGALATENAVKWMFDRHGVLKFIVPSAKVDELMDLALNFEVVDITVKEASSFVEAEALEDAEANEDDVPLDPEEEKKLDESEAIRKQLVRGDETAEAVVYTKEGKEEEEVDLDKEIAAAADERDDDRDDDPDEPHYVRIICDVADLSTMQKTFQEAKFDPNVDIAYIPKSKVELKGVDADPETDFGKFTRFVDAIEELEDVQRVFHNGLTLLGIAGSCIWSLLKNRS